jgi:hypothetical protein
MLPPGDIPDLEGWVTKDSIEYQEALAEAKARGKETGEGEGGVVEPLSTFGKQLVDEGEIPGSKEFKRRMAEHNLESVSPFAQLLRDEGVEEDGEEWVQRMTAHNKALEAPPKSERQLSMELYNNLESNVAFQHYNEDYLDSRKVLQALSNAQYVPGKGVLGQRGISELYNADTRAASEIERLIVSRGLAASIEDWTAKVTSGTIGQETWESYIDIATEVQNNSFRDRQENLLLNLRSLRVPYADYKEGMRRYSYPVNLDEEGWEKFKNE